MREPVKVLKSLEDKAADAGYKFKRLYRNLFNPEFYLLAYRNIAASQGSMTIGSDGKTLDGMSMERIAKLIETLKDHSYQPNPARRVYVKKANGKDRPIGIPSTDDRLVQEIIRMLLEAIYEPTFAVESHGFRPNRSCHTALNEVRRTFTGAKWMVEGDIKACFDSFDHHVLTDLLRKRIEDETFISLMWKFLRAGYMEQWEYHKTYSGSPQGSGMSPILANIYLNELDQFMAELKARFDLGEIKTGSGRAYDKASKRVQKARNALKAEPTPSKELVREFKDAQKQRLTIPYKDEPDTQFKRIRYNRYADDFIIGVIGSKEDAERIKEEIGTFLKEKLNLTLSPEKTVVTHSSERVRYLGYEIAVSRSKAVKRNSRGWLFRAWYGTVVLYVPKEKWVNKLHEHKTIQIKWDESKGRDYWRPMPRKELQNKADIEIVSKFNSEIRGLYNFYRLAENVSVLGMYYYQMRYSMLKTYAAKYRTTVNRVKAKYMHNSVFAVRYQTKAGQKTCEFYHDGFRKCHKDYDYLQDVLPQYIRFSSVNTLANRIKAGVCEMCGETTDNIHMHHVKSLKSLNGNTESEKLMLKMRRKSLALCPTCFNSAQTSSR
jgi:group II intron reverse transcriptase/maturase